MMLDTHAAVADSTESSNAVVDASFDDFLRRIRAGDQDAAAELVSRHGEAVLQEIRQRMHNRHLRRVIDSQDVLQDVLASFFHRAAEGQYDLSRPAKVLGLLVTMARNKVAYQARKEQAQCRDGRRLEAAELEAVAAKDDPSASQRIAAAELVLEFRRRLSNEEQRLADLWSEGHSWADIAAEMGGTPEARRMQWTRTVCRISHELGLEEERRT